MLLQIINGIVGMRRAKKLGERYGIPTQRILQRYEEFRMFGAPEGQQATLRAFEIMLRQELAMFDPAVKRIEPLYCKGLDPLKPYNADSAGEVPKKGRSSQPD